MNGSSAGRIFGVLTSPVKTFRSIGERPTWWPPLIVLVVLVGLIGVLVVQRMDFEATVRQQMAKQNRPISEEQIDQGVQMAKRFAPVGAVGSAVIFWPAVLLIIAVIYWVVFKLLGSDLTYPASFSVTVHSQMPIAVSQVLSIPILLSRQMLTPRDLQHGILVSNLAALAPEGASAALLALLASFDFFALWTLVLVALGYREVAKVSTAKAATTVAVFWLIVVGIRVGWAALFG